MQRYDIFNKHNNICIINDCFDKKNFSQREVIECDKVSINSVNFAPFFSDSCRKNILIIVKNDLDFEYAFKKIIEKLIFVPAAGGLVKNEKDEFLFIYRNKHWDLPKGHQEAGEDIELTAVREVEEETGLKNITLKDKLDITYHTYMRDGKRELKVTHWYNMVSNSNEKLTPQSEEGIDRVEWLSKESIKMNKDNIFPSLYHFLEKAINL
jgi:ADP-ribose pyrophosphatase YjhB (NUDIX family)